MTMKLTKSTIKRLKAKGFDGLYFPDGDGDAECGCKWNECSDGCPLSGDRDMCLPGVKMSGGIGPRQVQDAPPIPNE